MRLMAQTTLPVTPDTHEHALLWLEAQGHQQQWPARTVFKLRLCLDEVLTNLAMHGFARNDTSQKPCVKLRLRQEASYLTLEILDNGAAFDPTARTPREIDLSLDDAQLGGHGLRLLRHYLEDMRYERRDGWNRLELIAVIDDD